MLLTATSYGSSEPSSLCGTPVQWTSHRSGSTSFAHSSRGNCVRSFGRLSLKPSTSIAHSRLCGASPRAADDHRPRATQLTRVRLQAARALLAHEIGVLVAPTGVGKTGRGDASGHRAGGQHARPGTPPAARGRNAVKGQLAAVPPGDERIVWPRVDTSVRVSTTRALIPCSCPRYTGRVRIVGRRACERASRSAGAGRLRYRYQTGDDQSSLTPETEQGSPKC